MQEFNRAGNNLKVLVVEDEIFVAINLKQQLMQYFTLNVLTPVAKGEKAVEVAQAERPDLIFMDIILSTKVTGIEAARAILSIYNPVIIFTSGYIDEKISREIEKLHALGVKKPYDFNDLKDIIVKYFPFIVKGKTSGNLPS